MPGRRAERALCPAKARPAAAAADVINVPAGPGCRGWKNKAAQNPQASTKKHKRCPATRDSAVAADGVTAGARDHLQSGRDSAGAAAAVARAGEESRDDALEVAPWDAQGSTANGQRLTAVPPAAAPAAGQTDEEATSLYAQAASKSGQRGAELAGAASAAEGSPPWRSAPATIAGLNLDPEADLEGDPEGDVDHEGGDPLASFSEAQQQAAADFQTRIRQSQTAVRSDGAGGGKLRAKAPQKVIILQN